MLKALVRHPRQPLSRDKLAQLARGREFEPFDRSLDVQISRLRKMIEPDPTQPRYIQTVWGVGYVFVPDGAPDGNNRPTRLTRTAKRPLRLALLGMAEAAASTPRLAKKFVALSLFWRTFFLLALLLASGVFAWVQTFRALEFEPRAIQAAQQIASLVNLPAPRCTTPTASTASRSSRASRRSNRSSCSPREPNDKWEPFEVDRFQRVIERELRDAARPRHDRRQLDERHAGPLGRLLDRRAIRSGCKPTRRASDRCRRARRSSGSAIALLATDPRLGRRSRASSTGR